MRGLAIACLLILTAPAHADEFEGWRATGDLALDLRANAGAAGAAEVGPGLRATIGKPWLSYAAGIDVRAGGGVHGGFALDTALYPIGISLFEGSPVSFRIVGGVGVGGVSGHLPFAARIPVEAELEIHPVRVIELSAWGECAFVARDARDHGAADALFGDELTLGATIRVGRGAHQSQWHWSNGWRLGATMTERVGERAYGLVIGWGIDLSGGGEHGGGSDDDDVMPE
ncbi:MAG TPA: hypothetical protein VL463_13925 [Kofleriaceae bacterium]|nr:hypothetical protein [Kofleriaceae bacterium]